LTSLITVKLFVVLFLEDATDADGNFTYIDPDHTLTCRSHVSVHCNIRFKCV